MLSFVLLTLSACPDPVSVVHRVDALSPAPAGWTVRFTPTEASVRLDAAAAGQAFTRELPVVACDELEEAAVVILVSWQADLKPLPPVTRTVVTVAETPVVALPPAPIRWSVGGGASVLLTGVEPGFGLSASTSYSLETAPLALALGVEGSLPRRVPLEAGTLSWSSLTFSPGLDVRVLDRTARLWVGVRAVSGPLWLVAQVPTTTSLLTWDLGGRLVARLDWAPLGAVRPYFSASVTAWGLRHTVHLEGGSQIVTLPPAEGSLSVGIAWGG